MPNLELLARVPWKDAVSFMWVSAERYMEQGSFLSRFCAALYSPFIFQSYVKLNCWVALDLSTPFILPGVLRNVWQGKHTHTHTCAHACDVSKCSVTSPRNTYMDQICLCCLQSISVPHYCKLGVQSFTTMIIMTLIIIIIPNIYSGKFTRYCAKWFSCIMIASIS